MSPIDPPPSPPEPPEDALEPLRDEHAVATGAMQSPWVLLRPATLHPFIFARMIRQADPAARPGDVCSVYDKSGQLFGRGLFNPRSQISLRMLAHGATPIDAAFWRARLSDALALRDRLAIAAQSDAYRLVHSEGDGLSGLIVERYADCLAVELFSLGMFQRVEEIVAVLSDLLGKPASLDRPDRAAAAWRVRVRADEEIERFEGFRTPPAAADAPTVVTVREHGVRYRVDLAAGHKTGFFCDQRDNRRKLAAMCGDATVLDLCCYTGGFGLCARMLGRAREVTGVDLDESAIALARENANLNQVRIDHVHADVFIYLRQMLANRRTFDVVVLDPPKLAASRMAVEEALRKYYDMNALALQAVRPGGVLLTCSCSGLIGRDVFIETIHRAAKRIGRRLQLFDYAGAAPDHPVSLDCPETAYLKAAWLRVLPP